MIEPRHILYVDAYDSFSNSIVGLLKQILDVEVTIVRIDDKEASRNLETILKAFDAVVVGPGPGHPKKPSDVGLINQLWTLQDADILPVLGICLGFQSLALAHGADINRLRQGRHGIVSEILHCGSDIFENIVDIHATQYHSLHVNIGVHDQPSGQLCWEPTTVCPKLRPLAWDVTDTINGSILMSVRHVEKPFVGVQFHPESICTSKEGATIIRNWWMQAKEWAATCHGDATKTRSAIPSHITPIAATFATTGETFSVDQCQGLASFVSEFARRMRTTTGSEPLLLNWVKHYTGAMDPVTLAEMLGLDRDEILLLDSQGHRRGRYSILGVMIPDQTIRIAYRSWDRTLRYGTCSSNEHITQLDSIDQVWPMLQEVLESHNPRNHVGNDRLPDECPFWGGFVGYLSYEAGLETLSVALHASSATSHASDISFAFVHRSIVIDHETSQTYIQSLLPNDRIWVLGVEKTLNSFKQYDHLDNASLSRTSTELNPSRKTNMTHELERRLKLSVISTPEERHYRDKVLKCQESLAVGDSYELCLTDETIISVPNLDGKGLDPWDLYKKLRRKNPAPFGAFLRIANATVVGTSPERFLKWSRNGHCEFRPIKGTVKKSSHMTREVAHSILNSSKERAENLMIVDLIRHDLAGVVGAKNCSVSKLMTVEEYEHVYQLVSVIEGQLPSDIEGKGKGPTGLDVLKASLPPGSMTGAPKKRSCEILRDIEKRPRGIYSGVLGYLDVGGAGDFSVVIRTAVRDTDTANNPIGLSTIGETSNGSSRNCTPHYCSPDLPVGELDLNYHGQTETWRIGGGGAVTIQSTDEGEFQEMETKVLTVLAAFQTV